MTFKEYFKANKITTNYLLKIMGFVFSAIFFVIAVYTTSQDFGMLDTLNAIVLSAIKGNLLALFIWFLALISAFSSVKKKLKGLKSFTDEEIKECGITRVRQGFIKKTKFTEYEIFLTKPHGPIQVTFGKEAIAFTVLNSLKNYEDISQLIVAMSEKYKDSNISMTKMGFKKTVDISAWNNRKDTMLQLIIDELAEISNNERVAIAKIKKIDDEKE